MKAKWSVVLVLSAAIAAGCDPSVEHNPLDKGPVPGLVGGRPALAAAGWKPATGPGSTGVLTMPTGTGEGLPGDGAGLYEALCFKCHGADGRGGPAGAMLEPLGDLSSSEMHDRIDDEEMRRLVVFGKDKMPAFGGDITAAQLTALVAHARTLRVP